MSRSKHTTPARLRAVRRVQAPYAPRSQGERRRERALARVLKEMGFVPEHAETADVGERFVQRPRLSAQCPRAGRIYAVTVADVQRVLSFFGPHCFYGLRSVEFVQGEDAVPGTPLCLGRLLVPGRIVLYDHMTPPWTLPGRLARHERGRMRRAGALVEPIGQGYHTAVLWPGTTLRDFILFDVLMHEVGHHMVQQYTGKYEARVMRMRDHEAVAGRFAAHCRRVYGAPEHAQ